MTKKRGDREVEAQKQRQQRMLEDQELKEMTLLADREALLSKARKREFPESEKEREAPEAAMRAIRHARRKKGKGQWRGLPVSSFSKTVVSLGDVAVLQQVFPAEVVAERFYSNGVYERFYRDGTFHQIDADGKTVRFGIGSFLTF